jgi:hypothetical protein
MPSSGAAPIQLSSLGSLAADLAPGGVVAAAGASEGGAFGLQPPAGGRPGFGRGSRRLVGERPVPSRGRQAATAVRNAASRYRHAAPKERGYRPCGRWEGTGPNPTVTATVVVRV